MRTVAGFLLFCVSAFAQTGGLNIVGGKIDFSQAPHTATVKVVATAGALPASGCSPGELAVVSAATLGQQIYQNSGTGTCVWTQQLNSGGGSGGGGGITMYSGSGITVAAGTYYIPVGGGASPSATEANVDIDSPASATITNMFVQINVALGTGNTGVFTFRKNGASQSVTCTISGSSATSCSDTTHSFAVSQGDLLTVQLVTTGTIVVTPNILIAAQFGNITQTGTVNNCATAGSIAYYSSTGTAVNCIGADFTFGSDTIAAGASGKLDMSAAPVTGLRAPNVAGASTTTAGTVAYDTTNKNIHTGANGVDNFVALIPSASPPSNGNCAKFTVTSSTVTVVDAGAPCGTGTGGLLSGAMFTTFNPVVNTAAACNNFQNTSSLTALNGLGFAQYPTSWKVRMLFKAGSPVIGGMKILATLTGSSTVTSSTTVQIGGISNPTLTTPGLVDTDAISLTTDDLHDYWFVIYFTNVAANASVNAGATLVLNGGATTTDMRRLSGGVTAGDQTGVSTIPSLTYGTYGCLVAGGIIP